MTSSYLLLVVVTLLAAAYGLPPIGVPGGPGNPEDPQAGPYGGVGVPGRHSQVQPLCSPLSN